MLFSCSFFLFTGTSTTEIYTLSLHDALPISSPTVGGLRANSYFPQFFQGVFFGKNRIHSMEKHRRQQCAAGEPESDRKSTRLNSSHTVISYAVFCLKKKT